MTARSSTLFEIGPALLVLVLLLAVAATAVLRLTGIAPARLVATASARAALQLGVVSLVIAAIVSSLGLSALFVLVMFTVATRTAARRITHDRTGWWVVVPLALAVLPVVAAVLAAGVLPPTGLATIPVSGILLGGGMVAVALAGRRAADDLLARRGEVEAALALGFDGRASRLLVARDSALTALVPGLDQTRTVGLVTLPGTFVGMLLGGATPVEAGAVQLFVLVGILAVQAVAIAGTLELIVRGTIHLPGTAHDHDDGPLSLLAGRRRGVRPP